MFKIFKTAFILLSFALISGCGLFLGLTDLRSDDIQYTTSDEKARQLLTEMGEAHGISAWDDIETYQATFGDEFYGLMGKNSHPFKEQKMEFLLDYISQTSNGQMEIKTGKEKGLRWGIQSGQTYKLNGKDAVVKKNKAMKFWIPTYQYFIEFPNRIQEATAVAYGGETIINGTPAIGVIASWNTIEPQKDIDQYVIWIDEKTKRIIKVEYTIREMYGFISGAAYFTNYKSFGGLLLATEFPVESNLVKQGYLHKMSIIDFRINPVSAESLLPLKI